MNNVVHSDAPDGESVDDDGYYGRRLNECLPTIDEDEVAMLVRQYGLPKRLRYAVQADDYIHSYRWRKDSDRRAEVVFAIQNDSGRVWVHAKAHYPLHIFRLPSGGINWDEAVEVALLREVQEETALDVQIERFVGLIEYTFFYGTSTVEFASYIFHLSSSGGFPVASEGEDICEFRPVLPRQLSRIALDLRNLSGERRGWGQWRALAHDVVCESLSTQSLLNN
jgi:ADP-ribose pyrophosphatase YjhB (NUDIX family)